ncbi:hypothetical protein HDU98_008970 [Podochytrium sp. JEL0797]|nr:hypothetical protein HDU98_008970 [Podochytrium sp. JEL0797]
MGFSVATLSVWFSLLLLCAEHSLPSPFSSIKPAFSQAAADFLVDHTALPWAKGEEPLMESFSGLIDVRTFPDGWPSTATTDPLLPPRKASLFFWFFPCETKPSTGHIPPLIIWLQGGPGSSSMIGLFYETGPLRVTPELTLTRHNGTWNDKASMLFIDNPVGSGFSVLGFTNFTGPIRLADSDQPSYQNGFVINQEAVAHDLIIFLQEFYDFFPEQRAAKLFLTGESYAGKFIPAIARGIIAHNKNISLQDPSNRQIPLHGLAIGNGLTDPESQIRSHAPLALAMGLIGTRQGQNLTTQAADAVEKFHNREWEAATLSRKKLFAAFNEFTGNINPYDIRKGSVQNSWADMTRFLNRVDVKTALHVPVEIEFLPEQTACADALVQDGMKSMKGVVASLLDEHQHDAFGAVDTLLKVLLYQGQFDFRDGILSQTEWIESMKWAGQEGYLAATRQVWKIADSVVGYTTEFQNLKRVELLLAGHQSPMNAPEATRKMIRELIGV